MRLNVSAVCLHVGEETPALQEPKLPTSGAHTFLLPTDHLPGMPPHRGEDPQRTCSDTKQRRSVPGGRRNRVSSHQKLPIDAGETFSYFP